MKKTLAAVLAAAMALSTASVVLAVDDPDLSATLRGDNGDDDVVGVIEYGNTTKRNIQQLGEFSGYFLADLVDAGYATVKPIVTEGSSKLDGTPSVTLKNVVTSTTTTQTTENKEVYTWKCTLKDANGSPLIKANETIRKFPVFDNGTNWTAVWNDGGATQQSDGTWKINDGIDVQWAVKGKDETYGLDYQDLLDWAVDPTIGLAEKSTHTLTDPVTTSKKDKLLQLSFKVKDTFGTKDTTIGLKLRVTFKKDYKDADGNVVYKKGNTYTTEEYKYKAEYHEIAAYAEDMQVTSQEVSDRYVILKGGKLYDEVGNGTFNIAFGDDVALFIGKGSASQKDLNLYYNIGELDAVPELAQLSSDYPEVDFEFITFRGAPGVTTFVNKGTMIFPAINGDDTTVYRLETGSNELVPLVGKYDPTYKTIEVNNIRNLSGSFVIASEILEEEEPDEPAEPVSSAPVVEGPEEDENPKTGAC